MDIITRQKKIGKRIEQERKKKHMTQSELGSRVSAELGGGDPIPQNTISGWEKGKLPPLDKLIALSSVLECDCGYLLCDYDEEIHGITDICRETGLSKYSVKTLCRYKGFFGGLFPEISEVIDFLIYDYEKDNRSMSHQPLFQLLHWFFQYDKTNSIGKAVTTKNKLVNYRAGYSSYSSDRISLDGIIENAVLMEIQRALISLKEVAR